MRLTLLTSALLAGAFATAALAEEAKRYEPTWESLDARETPKWFSDAKFGIFIHWGVYAVPAWGQKGQYSEWYWRRLADDQSKGKGPWLEFHNRTYGPEFKYPDFAPRWKLEMWEPKQWAELFKRAGARYVVLTSKHHEGFCLWPNPQSWNWNSVEVGPHRDIALDYIQAMHGSGLKAGFYYSLYEWFNPLYHSDVAAYVDQHMIPQLKDLITHTKPDIFWGDGEWEHPSETWRSTEWLAWIFNESPAPKDIAINDRWGKETRGKHGGYYTTEYGKVHADDPDAKFKMHPWEECRGMGASFGYNRNETISEYRDARTMVHELVQIVAQGGNLLLDIGPTSDGRIPVIMQERLVQIGDWLKVNGEAIYETRPWRVANDGEKAAGADGKEAWKSDGKVWFTAKGDAVYAITLGWPGRELRLIQPKAAENATVTMLGYSEPLKWRNENGRMVIEVPPLSVDEVPCQYAYAFKLTGVK
jgi:alpha-L-fucosidase